MVAAVPCTAHLSSPAQKYYTDPSKANAFISTKDVASAFLTSPEGVKRVADINETRQYSPMDMMKLVKHKCASQRGKGGSVCG